MEPASHRVSAGLIFQWLVEGDAKHVVSQLDLANFFARQVHKPGHCSAKQFINLWLSQATNLFF
jgi:hypothetical protein